MSRTTGVADTICNTACKLHVSERGINAVKVVRRGKFQYVRSTSEVEHLRSGREDSSGCRVCGGTGHNHTILNAEHEITGRMDIQHLTRREGQQLRRQEELINSIGWHGSA
ncbi:unnamed protein product [Schistosoma mattheei]|uniref:Uncharacterized protein n=1 Tax=Schistosoma mattheei TaxID=31246 RepID=A0A183NUF3_9TREM|nr:unnamed protein product [Schistosoma mattheei]